MTKNKLEHRIPRPNDTLKLCLPACHNKTLSVTVPSLITACAVTRENTPSRWAPLLVPNGP
jgi:hypothetical protein